ncbi:MAG: 3-hydroxybutyryl-CoA dehydrogenase [Calditrichaceae bacterium]|nr:3-hydroxybutyryl-CoA dehydrogenase [Calditrichaceae bacterium]MBN2707657.1 3-hydroxybutyryl-CoA dehydrogenase [Calditrichaceae bacterium]RQV93174.1 MAG: 3-hydroxybutyryl-CoA dehydrogenase [Calditrichota bacterium]
MADKEKKVMDIEILKQAEIGRLENADAIKVVAVFGAGTMGQGISQLIASKGMEVILIERNESLAKKGIQELEKSMDQEIARWTLTESEKKAILSRIKISSKIEDAIHGDLVIEAITENLEEKQNLWAKIDTICDPDTIFITNTSALSITEIASTNNRQDKVIGMHFLNPVPKIPLVEIVRGLKTSDETYQIIKNFSETLDKTAVEVFEYPGYITTRVIVPMINEAIHIVMEGVATAEHVDTAMKLGYNFPKGPLALADLIGLDELMAWMETLFRELGEAKYRPCPLLRKLVRAGHLGKKTGKGFFEYN